MAPSESPVTDSIKVETVTRHKNRQHDLFQAICGNCLWNSYLHPSKEKAEEIGDHHAKQCTRRINTERGESMISRRILARSIEPGDVLLTKTLVQLPITAVGWTIDRNYASLLYAFGGTEKELLVGLDREVGVL